MPFTFAHPAAALPLSKWGLPLSALVIGTMAPDFPYFLHLSTSYQYGHSLWGLLWFCIPVGLLVLGLFHGFLKWPLLALLPESHQARLAPVARAFRFGPGRQVLLILVALGLGALSHVGWDSFTHANGAAVHQLEVLRAPVIETGRGALPVYKVLQHGSTLLGAALLGVAYGRWLRRAPVSGTAVSQWPGVWRGHLVGMIVLVALVGAGASALSLGTGELREVVSRFVVVAIGILLGELVVYSGVWHLRAQR